MRFRKLGSVIETNFFTFGQFFLDNNLRHPPHAEQQTSALIRHFSPYSFLEVCSKPEESQIAFFEVSLRQAGNSIQFFLTLMFFKNEVFVQQTTSKTFIRSKKNFGNVIV